MDTLLHLDQGLRLLPAAVSDAQMFYDLDLVIFPRAFEDLEVHRDRLEVYLEGCFKIMDKEKMIGFFESELWSEYHKPAINVKASDRHNPKGTIFFITCIGFLPEYTGRGIGSQVMQFVFERAREIGCEAVYLQADDRSKGFYEKLGFQLKESFDGDSGYDYSMYYVL